MRDGRGAAVSAALAIGFWVAAWLPALAAFVVVLLVLAALPGSVAVRIGAPLGIATVGLLGHATARALRRRPASPAGVPVTRQDAPALWSMTAAAAGAAGVAPPDGITVIVDATASLVERTWLAGLLVRRRELYLGLPILLAWDAGRQRAAVAHELAHGSPRLGRFAPLAYRGRVAIARIIPRIPRRSPAGPLLRAYAGWYRRADASFGRAQELAADRIAAEFAGPDAVAAVLRDAAALDGLQRMFHAEYLSPGWQAGHVPDDVFGGFLRVLAARADEMELLRVREPEPAEEWDTHPTQPERLAALRTPEPSPPAASGGAEEDLVPDLPGLGRALQAVAFPSAGRTVVGWDDFFGVARKAEMEREADASLRAIARAVGMPVAGVAEVLDLVADGLLHKAAESVFGDLPPAETGRHIAELITLLLALAALDSGVARWRHSWTGTAELVAIDGAHLDLGEPATLAAEPATVDAARRQLAELGIDLTTAGPRGGDRTPARVPVIGGVVNVVVDGVRTDLLIVETGLILVPGLPRSRNGEAKRRLARFAAAGVLADGSTARRDPAGSGRADPAGTGSGHDDSARTGPARTDSADTADPAVGGLARRFVPFADVTTATALHHRRRNWEVRLRDGGTLTIRTALDSDELPGGWTALDDAVAFLARTRAATPARSA